MGIAHACISTDTRVGKGFMNECNKKNIIKFINKYLEDENYRSDVINQTKEAIKQLSTAQTPSRLAATAILEACNEK